MCVGLILHLDLILTFFLFFLLDRVLLKDFESYQIYQLIIFWYQFNFSFIQNLFKIY
jgi:hypothetical protein